MMLRGSSQAEGRAAELHAVVDGRSVDSGVPHGGALIRFVEAVLDDAADLQAARDHLAREAGAAVLVDAAAVIGNFQRMVRIADGTGIPLDDRSVEPSRELREELGLDSFHSARLPPSTPSGSGSAR